MSLRDIHIIDIYNEFDLSLIKNYSNEKYNYFLKIVNEKNRESYIKDQELNVISNKYYAYIKENRILGFVKAEISKDTKIASLYPEFITYKKDFLPNLCKYLLTNRLEEVFVFVNKNEDKIIKDLIDNNFISLATDNDNLVPLLMEKSFEKEENLSWKL